MGVEEIMSKKLPKQNAQQAFNQFLFDTMMERIRAAELLGEEILNIRNQSAELFKRIENLDVRLTFEGVAQGSQNKDIADIKKEMKEQREDYHGHIRQWL